VPGSDYARTQMRPIVDIDALEARIRAIAREVVRAELGERGDDWIDQAHSPLGRRTHCRLVRSGALPGVSVHRRVLVRRRDLDAYVEARRAPPAGTDELEPLRRRLAESPPVSGRAVGRSSADEAVQRARILGFNEAEARALARVGARRIAR
jgi:hypothetical protein